MDEAGQEVRQAAAAVEAAGPREMEDHPAWPMISRLPVRASASIPVTGFTVRRLIALACGQTVETAWPAVEDVPLRVGDLRVSWSEFEVVEQRLALRLTRLA